MVLLKPNFNVTINKTLANKNGRRYILEETSIDETNIVFVNIYAPNDPSQQILFLRDLSNFDYTTQSDTSQLGQSRHNCADTWACRTSSATNQFILFAISVQTPPSHNNMIAYLRVLMY